MRLQLRIVGKDVDYQLAYYYSGIFLAFEKYCLKYPPSKLQQEKQRSRPVGRGDCLCDHFFVQFVFVCLFVFRLAGFFVFVVVVCFAGVVFFFPCVCVCVRVCVCIRPMSV